MKSSLFSVLLVPLFALSAQPVHQPGAQQPAGQQAPGTPQSDLDHNAPPSSCPIRVDEAYLASDSSAPITPVEGTVLKQTLHATVVDASGKAITSYSVNARISLQPDTTLTNQPNTGTVTRRWKGDLQPDTPTKQSWTFPTGRFTKQLQRVWFDKVMFADGTSWKKTQGDGCAYAATGHIVQTKAMPSKGAVKAH